MAQQIAAIRVAKRWGLWLTWLVVVVSSAGCGTVRESAAPSSVGAPQGDQAASPWAEPAFDSQRLADGLAAIDAGEYGNIHSLLVFHHGALVLEHYRKGEDFTRTGSLGVVEHSRETLHDARSISKSIVALAVLHAHAAGTLPDLDQPVLEWLPEYAALADGDKARISIRHLLTMTAGLAWNEELSYSDPRNSAAQMNAAPDALAFVLSQPLESAPGTQFTYNGGLTQLLAAVLQRASGHDIARYVQLHLLQPMGITHYAWAPMETGQPDADSGLRLRSPDLAKFGLLLAAQGKWDGTRLLPAALVEQAMAEQIRIPAGPDAYPGDTEGYGFQMWRFGYDTESGQRVELVELSGNGGQKVQIDRARDIVVVLTAANYGRQGKSSFDVYPDLILPALRPD